MTDESMPTIELPLSLEQYHQLPRNAAYKYEYLGDRAVLSPRPRHFHAVLELARLPPLDPADRDDEVLIRPMKTGDWPDLVAPFVGAFHRVQPFGSLEEAAQERACRQALDKTQRGGDGLFIGSASFVAADREATAARRRGQVIGAALVTLLPPGDPADYDSYHWPEPPPPDAYHRRAGRPHLTWIFVSPFWAGQGVGTALLHAVATELSAKGYQELLSTFLLGNESSMLWHWRNGFRLLPYPFSARRLRRRAR